MTYAEKLKDPRWQKRRLEVLERGEWMCALCCDTSKTLHIHHLLYRPNHNPWEYADNELVALCADCHKSQTEDEIRFKELLLEFIEGWFFYDINNALESLLEHERGWQMLQMWLQTAKHKDLITEAQRRCLVERGYWKEEFTI